MTIFLSFIFMTSAFAKKEEAIPYKVVSEPNSWSAIVTDDSGKVGLYYKNQKKLTIPIVYDKISGTDNKSCHYVYKDGKVGCIASYGDVIAPIEFDELDCEQSHSYCLTKKNGKYGAYGQYRLSKSTTDIRIPNIYDDIEHIKNASNILVKKNGKYGVLNYDGTTLLPIEYSKIEHTRYPSGWIVQKNGKYGAFNEKGQPTANMGFDKIEFISGNYVVTHNNIKYFLCSKLVKFDSCKDTPRCEYPIYKGKVGYKPGQWLAIPIEYDDLIKTREHGGQHIAIKNGKYGILKNSYKVLPVEYDHIEENKYNYIVKKNGKYGLVNGYGAQTNIEYDSIKVAALTQGYNFESDYYAVEKDGKFGCITYDKKTWKYNTLLEAKYDDIISIGDRNNSFAIKQNGKYAIFKPDSKKELKFAYSDFKKSLNLVKVKKGLIWYYKDPEEILKNIAEPFITFATFFIWHLGG